MDSMGYVWKEKTQYKHYDAMQGILEGEYFKSGRYFFESDMKTLWKEWNNIYNISRYFF